MPFPARMSMQASPRLDADLKALERACAADAADRGMRVDHDRQVGVGRREVVQRFAGRCAIDHVDHVGFARLDHPLGLGPVGGGQDGPDAGFLLPQGPEIHQVAFHLALRVAEQVRGVVIVADHVERTRWWGRRFGADPGGEDEPVDECPAADQCEPQAPHGRPPGQGCRHGFSRGCA